MKKAEKGQVVVIFAFIMIAVLVIVALAVDGGSLFAQRRDAQSAADSAAFSGAAAITTGDSASDARAVALLRAATNGFNNDQATNWVTVNYPPASGPFANDMNHFQVIIRARVQTSFIQLVYPGAAESTSEAVVRFEAGSPVGGPNALVGLSRTDCDTVLVNGNMNVTIQGGSIFSNSTASGCYSMEKKGTSGTLNVTGGGIDVVGAFNSTGQSTNISPTPTTGVPPINTLFISPPNCTCSVNLSGAACAGNNVKVNNKTTITPGIYNNITLASNNDKLTMKPGLYCINGDFSATGGSISGSGVTIVMEGGAVGLTGNITINLSAAPNPTMYIGTDGSQHNYGGLLVYADPAKYSGTASKNTVAIGGSNGNIFTGTIYAPNTTCTLSGTSGTVTYNSQVYCYTVNVSGTADIKMVFSASQNWPIPPTLDLEY